jgi:SAM-dependent methyltransferase
MPPRSSSRADIQRFFAERAAGLEDRFPQDTPRYQRAVGRLRAPSGGVVFDAGCGSGRALAFLREVVGPHGQVIGLDLTWQMLSEARRRGRGDLALLVQGDLLTLPLRSGSVDGVFAAGLMLHLADPEGGLLELARVTRPGGGLVIFHPVCRAELMRRHPAAAGVEGYLSAAELPQRLNEAGWQLRDLEDSDEGYLITASRQPA